MDSGAGDLKRSKHQKRRSNAVSNTESNASPSESDSSSQQAKAKKKKTDNYPIQFKLMYRTSDKIEEPRAIERIWEDNREAFIVDSWRIGGLFHSTGLPDELVTLENWKTMAWDQLKTLLKEMMEDVILINKRQWTLGSSVKKNERKEDAKEGGSSVKDLFTEEDADRLMKEYNMLPEETVYYCILFRRALLVNPSFGNTHGRLALQNICIMLCNLMPLPYKHRCFPVNVGGSAPTWGGNCQIGYTFEDKDLTTEDLKKHLQTRDCTWNKKIRVPDLQIIDPLTSTNYWITGEVKNMDEFTQEGQVSQWRARRQAWEQALPGLRFEDESFAILITPTQAEVFQLRLVSAAGDKKERNLITYTKTYSFIDKRLESISKFATDDFHQFLSDIMGLMFRGSKHIREKNV